MVIHFSMWGEGQVFKIIRRHRTRSLILVRCIILYVVDIKYDLIKPLTASVCHWISLPAHSFPHEVAPRCSQILTRIELSAPSRPCLLFPHFPDAEGGVGRGWKQSLLWMGFRQRYTSHTRGFQRVFFHYVFTFDCLRILDVFRTYFSSPQLLPGLPQLLPTQLRVLYLLMDRKDNGERDLQRIYRGQD